MNDEHPERIFVWILIAFIFWVVIFLVAWFFLPGPW